MTEEAGWVLCLGLVAVLFVVINDWWKRRLVQQATAHHDPVTPNWSLNQTDWLRVALLVIGFAAYAIVRSNPAWTNDYDGPLSGVVQYLFPRR